MMDKKVCCSRDTGKYLYFYSPQQYPGRAFRREVGERSGHNRVNQHHVKGFTRSLPSEGLQYIHSIHSLPTHRGAAFTGLTGSLHTNIGTAFTGFTGSLHRQRDCIRRIHCLPTQTEGLHSQDS